MGLNQRRSNTNNRSTESEIVMQSILVKSKMRFYRTKSTFVIVGLRIRLLIFMRLTAETDNGLWLHGCNISYKWPLKLYTNFYVG